MFSRKPRGSRIIYVASSARELPGEVQQWLGHPDHRAASSPNIYDALALLATGSRPAVLIVSIESVDWSEMEFFDQAARLSRQTRIYVTGHGHQAAKLEAAQKKGARLFNAAALEEDALDIEEALVPYPAGPLPAARASCPPSEVQALTGEQASCPPSELVTPVPNRYPQPQSEAPDPELEPALDESLVPEEPLDEQIDPPTVRLVKPPEAEEVDREPTPFPWAPSPNRPQRIPPKTHAANKAPETPPVAQHSPLVAGIAGHPSIELTSEELAALMGRPIPSDAKEAGQ